MSTAPYLDPDEALKQAALSWRPGQPAIAPYQASQGLNLPAVGGKLGGAPQIPEQPQANAQRGTIEGDKAERSRLLNSGSGISQISDKIQGTGFGQNHPVLGKILGGVAQGAATVGDIGLRALAPFAEQAIPGTEGHHQQLVRNADMQLTQDEANAEKEAQTANLDAQPALKQQKAQLDQDKLDETQRAHENTLHEHGYKTGPDGQIVPLTYDEMSETQQAVHDLKGAQEEEQQASAALKKAQADPNSPQARAAQQRIDNARASIQNASRRLGLSEKVYDARYLGLVPDGQGGKKAAPGAMITDEGQPVGSSFSQNVRPTGTERNKADMAGSAKEQLNDILQIVHSRPDIFGPAAGRKTDFDVWVGSQDPDAQRFRAARTIAGDHLAGTFGGRSEAALDALDKAIGVFKDNPAAVDSGVNQLVKANERFLKAGSVRTAGSNVNKEAGAATPTGAVATGKGSDGKTYWLDKDNKPLGEKK